MSGQGRTWEPLKLTDVAFYLRVCEPVRAGELLRALLASKAMATRVLSRGQLRCAADADMPLAYHTRLAAGQELALTFWRESSALAVSGHPSHPADRQPSAWPPASVRDADPIPLANESDKLAVSGHQSHPADQLSRSAPPATIRYADPILLAADKPAGLLVHGDGTGGPTLTAKVQATLARQGLPSAVQAVQRLDVDTTGLVLFSRTEEFQPALDALVAGHDLRKRYLAVIAGKLPATGATHEGWELLEHPIARDRHDARRMRVGPSGKPARTRVRTLTQHQGRSLLLVELDSGRRHQIRVHLAHIGRPILGDSRYGGRAHADGLMLHAWQVCFDHPATGAPLCLEAPCPERFRRLFPHVDGLLRAPLPLALPL